LTLFVVPFTAVRCYRCTPLHVGYALPTRHPLPHRFGLCVTVYVDFRLFCLTLYYLHRYYCTVTVATVTVWLPYVGFRYRSYLPALLPFTGYLPFTDDYCTFVTGYRAAYLDGFVALGYTRTPAGSVDAYAFTLRLRYDALRFAFCVRVPVTLFTALLAFTLVTPFGSPRFALLWLYVSHVLHLLAWLLPRYHTFTAVPTITCVTTWITFHTLPLLTFAVLPPFYSADRYVPYVAPLPHCALPRCSVSLLVQFTATFTCTYIYLLPAVAYRVTVPGWPYRAPVVTTARCRLRVTCHCCLCRYTARLRVPAYRLPVVCGYYVYSCNCRIYHATRLFCHCLDFPPVLRYVWLISALRPFYTTFVIYDYITALRTRCRIDAFVTTFIACLYTVVRFTRLFLRCSPFCVYRCHTTRLQFTDLILHTPVLTACGCGFTFGYAYRYRDRCLYRLLPACRYVYCLPLPAIRGLPFIAFITPFPFTH